MVPAVIILFVRARKTVETTERSRHKTNPERYRSGHNEAVLKTVCPYGHMGSNPILSAF